MDTVAQLDMRLLWMNDRLILEGLINSPPPRAATGLRVLFLRYD